MNRKVTIITSVVTVVVLLGLVGMQLYWIQGAAKMREASFRRSVDEAMSKVVYKLERLETAHRIRQRMYEKPRGSSFINTMDSISYLFLKELDSIPWATGAPDSSMNFSGKNVKIEITRDDNGQIVKRLDTSFNKPERRGQGLNLQSQISVNPSVPQKAIKNLNDQFKQLLQKSYMITDVFEDMFSLGKRQPVEERISKQVLDSLIRQELSLKGLDIDYQFGVYSTGREKMVLTKGNPDPEQLKSEGMAFKLYPSEIFMSPEYLMLYFPGQKKFLLTQMAGMLIVSVVLIILIIMLFGFTINTIVKQRKVAEMKNDFINNMTHEFKTPISTVSLACQALSDKDIKKSEELYSSYIQVISEENKRLGSLAEKILQTAIIEKEETKMKDETVDIHQLIEEAININRMQVEIKDGIIKKDLKATQTILSADHDHMLNVLNNLLDNANKYTPKKPEIEVSTINTLNQIVISISDNGVGIGKSDQKKIFDKLYRVHTGNLHDVKGFGLGLSYVKFIIEKHGGKITLESELNKGSTFRIYLPFNKEN
ncbi:MAG: HAMP domain-containing histidine kinase [Bacteroidales bacterium]|nr:HAMP domain-containing histidine kinase [Bacteroidales bacterium]MCF8334354.1 HAMP domain-containing histidine kinase [Bacteroidales bacterium]